MKFTVNAGILNSVVDKAARFANGKNTDKIVTSHIYMAATTDGGAEICSTNLAVAYRKILFDVEVEESGAITVPAILLKNIIAQLPTSEAVIFSTVDNTGLRIKSPSVSVEIRGIDADDFPYMMFGAANQIAEITGITPSDFASACGQVLPFVSNNNAETINGVLLKASENTIVLSATDKFRLVLREMTTTENLSKIRIVIPSESLKQFVPVALSNAAKELAYSFSENKSQIVFHMGDEYFVCPLMQADNRSFPDLERFFSPLIDGETQIKIPSDDLMRHARISSLFVDETRIPSVVLHPKTEYNTLELESAAPVGKSLTTVQAAVSGDNSAISLNVLYLKDAIESAKSKMITLQIIDDTKPLLIVGEGYKAMIMPFELAE